MQEAIGIDIGGTRLRVARVDAAGRILARAAAPSAPDPAVVLARCLGLVADVRGPLVGGIGIGVPGQVEAASRRVLSGGYVDLSAFDFAALMEAGAGLPVVIENDATMALLGEAACGAARGLRHVVMLTIGTGIGGAILEDGQVLRGRGSAGQLGHIVVQPGGRPCVCGRAGCVETVSSGTAFGLHLVKAGLPAGTLAEDLLRRGDDVARGVLEAWAGPLRVAIDTLIAVCNPECVVIGGGAGAAALAALAALAGAPPGPGWFQAPVVAAALGDDAGVVGAAMACLRRHRAKRAVLVNGVPASGKSSVAQGLASALGWPLLTLDTIKAPFLEILPPGDRLFNRTLGRASYAAMFDLIRDAPAGSGFVLDAWFGFQPYALLAEGLARAGIADTAELWCVAPPEVVGARYGARLAERGPGHPGAEYVPELIALAACARPAGQGPVLTVDTTLPVDVPGVRDWVLAMLGQQGER